MILPSDQRRDLLGGFRGLATDLVKAGPGKEVGNEEFRLFLMAILRPVRRLDRFPIQRLDSLQR
jgi:hypothetical protein